MDKIKRMLKSSLYAIYLYTKIVCVSSGQPVYNVDNYDKTCVYHLQKLNRFVDKKPHPSEGCGKVNIYVDSSLSICSDNVVHSSIKRSSFSLFSSN